MAEDSLTTNKDADGEDDVIAESIIDPIHPDLLDLLRRAYEAHTDDQRTATVTMRVSVKADKETGKTVVSAKIQAVLPVGEHDSKTVKVPSVALASFGGDHPGQERLAGT